MQEQTMDIPKDRKYSETHEWFALDGETVTVGITQYAADELTDITYVELPEVGATVAAGDSISEVESVKATSEVTTSVGGTIVETNTALVDQPELINNSAHEDGWLVKIKPDAVAALDELMDAAAYGEMVAD